MKVIKEIVFGLNDVGKVGLLKAIVTLTYIRKSMWASNFDTDHTFIRNEKGILTSYEEIQDIIDALGNIISTEAIVEE